MGIYLSYILQFDIGPFYKFVNHFLNSQFQKPKDFGTSPKDLVVAVTLANLGLY